MLLHIEPEIKSVMAHLFPKKDLQVEREEKSACSDFVPLRYFLTHVEAIKIQRRSRLPHQDFLQCRQAVPRGTLETVPRHDVGHGCGSRGSRIGRGTLEV